MPSSLAAGDDRAARPSKVTRRLASVSGVFLALAVALATAPIWLPALALLDLARGGKSTYLRTAVGATWIVVCEAFGILIAGGLWLWHLGGSRDPEAYLRRNYAFQCHWATSILSGVQTIFAFTIEVEPGGEPALEGPILLLPRHASMGDTLLPTLLFHAPHGILLRYVLKSELLWDPCLDIVGHRIPNVFVDRDGPDGKSAREAIANLASDLDDHEGVLIYPEGTRFTAARHARALDRVRAQGDAEQLAHAASLRHLLPPRLGGTLTLLDQFAAEGRGHVVVCGHHGFEGSAHWLDLVNGRMTGRRIRVRCWSTPVAELPADRRRWLFDAWTRMDDWIESAPDQA